MQEGVFHLSVKMVQRSKGRSATAAIAYRAGIDIVDERTGLRFDYTRKSGISYSEIVLPEEAPEEYRDRKTLWNAIEQAETRMNSAVAREFELALPYDLPRRVREQLVSDVAHYIVERFKVPADANCHDPHPRKNQEHGSSSKNYHVHILTGTRRLTDKGFTEKARELDSVKTGSAIVEELRMLWASLVNEAYKNHRVEKFIDHRSNERRGIQQTPQIHIGVNQDGDRAGQNAVIVKSNAQVTIIEREIASVQSKIDELVLSTVPPGHTESTYKLELTNQEPRQTLDAKHQVQLRPHDGAKITVGLADSYKSSRNIINQPEATINLVDLRRYQELEDLKKKARVYGRAIAELENQQSNADSFQREFDSLVHPGVIHRWLGSNRWRAYEKRRNELQNKITIANIRAEKLRLLAKEHRDFQNEWDRNGHGEHKRLARDLGFGHPSGQSSTASASTPQPALGLSPLVPSILPWFVPANGHRRVK